MLPNNLLKIKSLEEIICIKCNLIESTDLDKEELKLFHDLINFENSVEIKKTLIPIDLLEEVKNVVKNSYDNDWSKYIESIQIYFDTFTLESIAKCNAFHGELYNSGIDAKQKKIIRNIRKEKISHACSLLRLIGLSGKHYTSLTLFNEFKINKTREQDFIKNSAIVGTDGKIIPLKLACKTAKQNVAEKININDTIEKISLKRDWTWAFITVTLDKDEQGKSYHPNPTSGTYNYNGISVKESSRLLSAGIKNVRALLASKGIKASSEYIGVRVCEAHKDGCAHLHLMFFASDKSLKIIKDCFEFTFPNMKTLEKSFVLEDDENKNKPYKKKNEEYIKGKFRVKASSYLFKYTMKSISSFDENIDIMKICGVDKKEDEMTEEEKKQQEIYMSALNQCFRSSNSIRGYSFFGLDNCLTKFRYLARNVDDLNLPIQFQLLLKENNLFELIEGKYFDNVENIYVDSGNGKKFVGCKINSVKFIKNFFKMTSEILAEKGKDIFVELAILAKEDALHKLGLILNPNYTRKAKEFEKPTAKERKDWLEWIRNNPAT